MEFPEHGRLVPGSLKDLWKGELGGIKGKPVVDLPMQVTVFSCENGGP
jgi:hypothetical protein